MNRLPAKPLTASAFAPYGAVLEIPASTGKAALPPALGNLRVQAQPDLSVSCVEQVRTLPLEVTFMERHQFSSQTFMPLDASCRYLVIVAPPDAQGGPDGARAEAFIAHGGQSITYHPDTWHYSLTLLAGPARFAVWMWKANDAGDEEFVDIPAFEVVAS